MLKCVICGQKAGAFSRYWMLPEKHGICKGCAKAEIKRLGQDEMARAYGQAGINYEDPNGRRK